MQDSLPASAANRTVSWNPLRLVRAFFVDYLSRHTNNWNRVLHVIGVPLAPFLFLYLLVAGRFIQAAVAFVAGYLLQWIGHSIEGNEVGELILAKWIARKLAAAVTGGVVGAEGASR
jgi:hypothetical protein